MRASLALNRNRWFYTWARICKRLRNPGIDSEESIPPAYVALAGRYEFFLDILACISDSYLRLTTAHTQKLQHYPRLPLKVVMGSIFMFSSAINIG